MEEKKKHPMRKKYELKLNSLPKLEMLLQELYDEACKNIQEIQNEIQKLSNSVTLNNEIIDGKAKYAKAMNDFSTNKNKAIQTKLDIAKIMSDIIKLNNEQNKSKMIDLGTKEWDSLMDQWDKNNNDNKDDTGENGPEVYHI